VRLNTALVKEIGWFAEDIKAENDECGELLALLDNIKNC
jgi:hypothetical protein